MLGRTYMATKIQLKFKPNLANSQPIPIISNELIAPARPKIKITMKSKLTAKGRWILVKQRFRKRGDAIKLEWKIDAWAQSEGLKRGADRKLREFRATLAKLGKNICFGFNCKGQIQDISLFQKDKNNCRSCSNKISNDAFHRNNGHAYQRTKWIYKYGKSCKICGCSDINLLEFDHIDPDKKKYNICQMTGSKKLLIEAEKCQLLCIWCHRLRSQEQRNNMSLNQYTPYTPYTVTKDFVDGIKLAIGCCQSCERTVYPDETMCFDFDHLNPSTKFMNISQMISNHHSNEHIIEEIQKCWLLCCICHKLKTNIQLQYPSHHKIILKKKVIISKCEKCKCEITKNAKLCVACSGYDYRVVKIRPSLEQIKLDHIQLGSFLAIGRKYGVSDNAIRKWIAKAEKDKQSQL